MREVTNNMTFPPTNEKIKEFEALASLHMEGRTRALHKCRKVCTSEVDSHPAIKKEQPKLRLIELLIERNG
eukprot:9983823-Ditylum_brightwellii.AAC.1